MKKFIVLIDDDEETLFLTSFLLDGAGFDTIGFTDGGRALRFLNKPNREPAAVISDLSLPTLDGLTIVEQIRLNEQAFERAAVPLAFYTAHDQAPGGATERIAGKCNVSRIWHKPADTENLPQLVNEWLDEQKRG